MSGRTNKHRKGEKSRSGAGARRSRSASNSPSCRARTVRHVMYVGGGGGVNHDDDEDDHSYCESCSGCNPEGGGSPSSSSSSSSTSSEGAACVVDSAPTPRRAHSSHTKYVPTYPAYPKQHSFIVDMNNRPLYEVEKKPKSPARHVRAKSASPSKQAATAGCSLAHLPPATKDNAPYFPSNMEGKEDKKKAKRKASPSAAAGGQGDWKMAKKILLYVLVFVIVVTLFFSLLGMTIDIHGKMSDIKRIENGVSAIKNYLNLTNVGNK